MRFWGQIVTGNKLIMITKLDVQVALFHLLKDYFILETSVSVIDVCAQILITGTRGYIRF